MHSTITPPWCNSCIPSGNAMDSPNGKPRDTPMTSMNNANPANKRKKSTRDPAPYAFSAIAKAGHSRDDEKPPGACGHPRSSATRIDRPKHTYETVGRNTPTR